MYYAIWRQEEKYKIIKGMKKLLTVNKKIEFWKR
jgi:hypothetical protein